jgi:DNA-binding XRE family transcriptional regulator
MSARRSSCPTPPAISQARPDELVCDRRRRNRYDFDPGADKPLFLTVFKSPGQAEKQREMITGEHIRTARKLLGWSQMALALEARVDQSTVAKFESGESRPSVLTFSTIKCTP